MHHRWVWQLLMLSTIRVRRLFGPEMDLARYAVLPCHRAAGWPESHQLTWINPGRRSRGLAGLDVWLPSRRLRRLKRGATSLRPRSGRPTLVCANHSHLEPVRGVSFPPVLGGRRREPQAPVEAACSRRRLPDHQAPPTVGRTLCLGTPRNGPPVDAAHKGSRGCS